MLTHLVEHQHFEPGRWWKSYRLKAPPALPLPADHAVIGRLLAEAHLQKLLSPRITATHVYILGATGTGKTNCCFALSNRTFSICAFFCVIDLRSVPTILAANAPASLARTICSMDLRRVEIM